MDQEKHQEVIDGLIRYINNEPDNPFILKGGTALAQCYGLDRFSEDVDFDVDPLKGGSLLAAIDGFCRDNGLSYRVGKDTPSVQRAFIDYGSEGTPLKVEASYRRTSIPESSICKIDGIQTYGLDEIATQKTAAYLGRDKIRDLYDVSFICTNFGDQLKDETMGMMKSAFEYKDLDQFDYLIRTQDDPLIDNDKLEDMFLRSFEVVGLLLPDDAENVDHKDDAEPPDAVDSSDEDDDPSDIDTDDTENDDDDGWDPVG